MYFGGFEPREGFKPTGWRLKILEINFRALLFLVHPAMLVFSIACK